MRNFSGDALATVQSYHQAWTGGDVDQALTYVSDDVRCFAPDENVTTQNDWCAYLTAFVPMLTGAPEHTRMTDQGSRSALVLPADGGHHNHAGQRTVHGTRRTDRRDPPRFRPPRLSPATTAAGMTRVPPDESTRRLIDRIRVSLPDHHLRELSMFGVTAIMVNNAMAVAVHKDGSLLVRVDPAEDASLLNNPHASRAQMGTGRPMGEGWIRVDPSAVRGEAALVHWLQAATRNLARLGATNT